MTHFIRIALIALTLLSTVGCALERDVVEGAESAVTGRPYFELWEADNGDHYFNLSAANHEVMLSSEGYSSRSAALNGVLSVLDNGVMERRYEVRQASNGQHYVVLKARNGRVIGITETYASRSGANAAIDSMMNNVDRYQGWLAERAGARFDVFRGVDGDFYFALHAANGAQVLQSQGYSSEASALNATFSVASFGTDAEQYDVREAANGGYYFNIMANNGQVIGTSEVYSTRSNATRARDSIIALLPTIELL